MPGPPRKPPSERRRRNTQNDVGVLELIDGDRAEIPELVDVWSQDRPPASPTVRAWENIRSSSHIVRLVDTMSDLNELVRWAELFDERYHAWNGYQSERLVENTRGSVMLNPLFSVVKHCDLEMGKLADRFGLNLIGRMRLGIELADAHKGLTEAQRLNQLAEQAAGGEDDDVIDIDEVRNA